MQEQAKSQGTFTPEDEETTRLRRERNKAEITADISAQQAQGLQAEVEAVQAAEQLTDEKDSKRLEAEDKVKEAREIRAKEKADLSARENVTLADSLLDDLEEDYGDPTERQMTSGAAGARYASEGTDKVCCAFSCWHRSKSGVITYSRSC